MVLPLLCITFLPIINSSNVTAEKLYTEDVLHFEWLGFTSMTQVALPPLIALVFSANLARKAVTDSTSLCQSVPCGRRYRERNVICKP